MRWMLAIAATAGLWGTVLTSEPVQAASDTAAQQARTGTAWSSQQRRRVRRAPTRITVYPNTRYYRACVDWYALERRPSGTVIVPHMACRWAVR